MTKPALGAQTDLQMAIYVSSLRFDIAAGRVGDRYWVETKQMLADCGTKLQEDGSVDIGMLHETMDSGRLKVQGRYKVNSEFLHGYG